MGVEDNWPYGQKGNVEVDTTPCEVPGCGGDIPEDQVDDRHCHGCGAKVCEAHDNADTGWGSHRPEDHKEEEESW